MNFDDLINQTLNTEDIVDEGLKHAALAGLLGLGSIAGSQKAVADEPTPIEQQVQKVNIDKLLDALQYVESKNDPKAIGDNGKAYGILQIWKVVIDDVNRIYKTNYKHEDAFDKEKARDIAKKYLHYWGYRYSRNEKQSPTYEVLARIWNGGPQGYKNKNTNKYWEKVKDILS